MAEAAETINPITVWALPLAVVAFVFVAATDFRGLPESVPVHFNFAGEADRWLAPKRFIALQIGLAGSLAALIGFARWITMQGSYDPEGKYRQHPRLRVRTLVVLDLIGTGGIALVAWTGHLCAEASHMAVPALNRLALIIPLALLIVGAALGAWWAHHAKNLPSPPGGR
jgi:hypothetical protein